MTNTPDPFEQQSSDAYEVAPPMPAYQQADSSPQYGDPQHNGQQYPQPGTHPSANTEKNWMGITSLVLTLASLIMGITVIGGIILGHMSIAATKRGEATNGNLGRWGMILGYVFVGLSIIATVGLIWFFVWVETECGGTWPSHSC